MEEEIGQNFLESSQLMDLNKTWLCSLKQCMIKIKLLGEKIRDEIIEVLGKSL